MSRAEFGKVSITFFINFHLYLLQYICYHMEQSCCYFCVVSSVDIGGDMEHFQVNIPEVFFMKVFINLLEEIPLDGKNMNVLDRRYYCSLHGQLYLDMIYIFLDKLLNKMLKTIIMNQNYYALHNQLPSKDHL